MLPEILLKVKLAFRFTLSYVRGVSDVYRRIRDLREDHDLKQRQMAEILGCSQRTYSDYECGKTRMPPDVLIELSRYYGTSVDYLLDLTDVKAPYPRNDGR